VDEADGARYFRVFEFLVEVGDLRGEQEALVDDGAARERRQVEEIAVTDVGGGDLVFATLADGEEAALEFVFAHAGGAVDEDLLDVRLRVARQAADRVGIDWGVAPAEDGEALFANDTLDDAFTLEALGALNRQEDHADAVLASLGQGEAEFCAFTSEELVRDLDENAGTVAGVGVAAAGAAMGEVDEDLDPLLDDVVGFFAFDVGYETETAGIAFAIGVIEALAFRESAEHGGICDIDHRNTSNFIAV